MITFYPGPSKIYPEVARYVSEGLSSGILSMNHRSPEFMDLMAQAIRQIREKLGVPDSYQIVFTSSATECWEIIAQSLVKKSSAHLYNGAFGEKWMQYTRKLGVEVSGHPFAIEEEPVLGVYSEDTICITHNETSNGTGFPEDRIREVSEGNKGSVIAIDATSSMAGVKLDFTLGDVWFASVQKCFGLPAGLAVMIISPNAQDRVMQNEENDHYNSLSFILRNAEKYQTPYTPNILGIYLLKRTLEERAGIESIHAVTQERFNKLESALGELPLFEFLVRNERVRSLTVLAITSNKVPMDILKREARDRGIILGNGYGPWKESTFRIANFPAITEEEVDTLVNFLSSQN